MFCRNRDTVSGTAFPAYRADKQQHEDEDNGQMKHQLDATLQVLFLQVHSTCFGRKRPSSGVFKTSTAATGTCVIVAGQSSQLLIRAGTECIHLTYTMMLGSTKLEDNGVIVVRKNHSRRSKLIPGSLCPPLGFSTRISRH